MRIAIVGAGSVGGYVGARLALAGNDVTFIARGPTLAAIKRDGITLIDPAGECHRPAVKAAAIDEPGQYDTVLLGLKAHQIAGVSPNLTALLKPDGALVPLQNGIPWWYFHKSGGPYEGHAIAAVDPDEVIGRSIDPSRVVGAVVYMAGAVEAPGIVRVTNKGRFILGEPDGSANARTRSLVDLFAAASLPATLAPEIRTEIWFKVWGNLMFNPLSALTRAGLADICRDAGTRALAAAGMAECETIANKLGVRMPMDVNKRIDITEALGNHKTSMLQDIEAGRPPEIDALGGAVIELARMTGIATPTLDAVYACVGLLSRKVAKDR